MTIVDDVDLFESMGRTTFARPIHESDDPSFFYVLTVAGRAVGRIGVVARESCPPSLRGSLPEREFRLIECMLVGEDTDVRFLRDVLTALPAEISPYVDVILNPELHRQVGRLRSVCEQAGMALFQEKHSYQWDDRGRAIEVPRRLTFADIDAVGEDAFARIIGRAGAGTIDRNDRWYRGQTGPENWGRVFLSYLIEEHRDSWLVGYDTTGRAVGFITVSDTGSRRPTEWDRLPSATIPMMGVLPEHRGRGYVDDLLAAGTAAAQRTGFVSMIDTVDVLNTPMDAAMVRGGHFRGVRPWHVWHYRTWL